MWAVSWKTLAKLFVARILACGAVAQERRPLMRRPEQHTRHQPPHPVQEPDRRLQFKQHNATNVSDAPLASIFSRPPNAKVRSENSRPPNAKASTGPLLEALADIKSSAIVIDTFVMNIGFDTMAMNLVLAIVVIVGAVRFYMAKNLRLVDAQDGDGVDPMLSKSAKAQQASRRFQLGQSSKSCDSKSDEHGDATYGAIADTGLEFSSSQHERHGVAQDDDDDSETSAATKSMSSYERRCMQQKAEFCGASDTDSSDDIVAFDPVHDFKPRFIT
mmetsp:Transcript_86872/g.153417  ORF Transcript_86872/g.153417 Transcript_86872/m.153417 type:complete len:274 (-) Transcript_86872:142-963(-)